MSNYCFTIDQLWNHKIETLTLVNSGWLKKYRGINPRKILDVM